MRYDGNGCLNLGPSEIGYYVHLVDHSTRVGVLLFAVLHRANESQPARNSAAVHGCRILLILGLVSIMSGCRIKFSTQSSLTEI